MPKPQLIAADTNVLIDLAAKDPIVLDCFSTVKIRLDNPPILVLPTVIQELAYIADLGETAKARDLALKALRSLLHPWNFQPVNCVPVGHGIVEETARKIRAKGLVPEEEVNDSLIVAEAALVKITVLLSSDSHLKDIEQSELKAVLERCDLPTPLIFSPKKIVTDFFRAFR